jgi:hypothetical protein
MPESAVHIFAPGETKGEVAWRIANAMAQTLLMNVTR